MLSRAGVPSVCLGVPGGGTGPPAEHMFRRGLPLASAGPLGPLLSPVSPRAIQPPDGRAVQPLPPACSQHRRLAGAASAVFGVGHGVRGQGDACGEVPGGIRERFGAGLRAVSAPTSVLSAQGSRGLSSQLLLLNSSMYLRSSGDKGGVDVLPCCMWGQALLWQEGRAIHQALELRHGRTQTRLGKGRER